MSVTINATPGAPDANSFLTQEEADAYFAARLPLNPPWSAAVDPSAALVMATRVLSAYAQPLKYLVSTEPPFYYRVRRQWTGTPATTTQKLPWPRIGMFDANGNPIPQNVVPDALKEATAELAGQLVASDTTLDNAASAVGLKSVSAGSVSVTFKDMIESRVLPDAVWNLMPPSWFTADLVEPALLAQFDVVSQ